MRSSANAEDIPNFDGAGLHDSFAASLKTDEPAPDCHRCEVASEADGSDVKLKVKPKSLGCAVKGVYASLWNLPRGRRARFRADRAVERGDGAGFSETTIAGFISDEEPLSFTVTRLAKPVKDGPVRTSPVLPDDKLLQMVDITKAVERAYCAAKRDYYGDDCGWVTATTPSQRRWTRS